MHVSAILTYHCYVVRGKGNYTYMFFAVVIVSCYPASPGLVKFNF